MVAKMDKEKLKARYQKAEETSDSILHRLANWLDDLADSPHTVLWLIFGIVLALSVYVLLK